MTPHEAFYRKMLGYYPTKEQFLSMDKEALIKWFLLTEEWYVLELEKVRPSSLSARLGL